MRYSKGIFGRIDGQHDNFLGEVTCPNWLRSFADKMAKDEGKTAVEAARDRNANIYEQMSSILSPNGPRFSSVEDVVAHYREQIGMDKYQKSALAAKIIEAGDTEEEDIKKKV